MTTSGIAETYARVLFDLAAASDSVDVADEGIRAVAQAVRGSIDLRHALADTQLPVEKKRDVLREIFGDHVAPEVLAIVTLAVERDHVESLGEVRRLFGEIAEKERGIVVAEVTTAVALDEATRASVVKKLSAVLSRPVTLRERVDASIVGGIRINVAGRVLDGTLSSQLTAMRTALATSSSGGGV